MPHFEQEIMNAEFTKSHILGLPFDAVLHHFTAPDKGGPHDHPFSFHSKVLFGGYIERVYHIDPDGTWRSVIIEHKQHDCFFVAATHIHEIIDFPDGDCYTLILPEKWEREWRFWSFNNGLATSRVWNEADFKPYNK